MQFSSRFVVYALGASLFTCWLVAEGAQQTDLPNALREIQESVRHLSDEVRALQSSVKDLASATKHAPAAVAGIPVPPRESKSQAERAREAYDRASGSEKLKLYPAAVAAYTESIALDPKNEAAFLRRGLCYTRMNELENALADLNQSLRLQPDNSRGYAARAAVESKLGQSEKALADLQQALERDPNYSEAHLLRGELLLRNGDAPGAVVEFSSAKPLSERAYLMRSEAYRTTGQLDLALADCNEALRINPESTSGFLCRAECYLKQGHADRALDDLTRASTQDPASVKTIAASARRILEEQASRQNTAAANPPPPPPTSVAPEPVKQSPPPDVLAPVPLLPKETQVPVKTDHAEIRPRQIAEKALPAPNPDPPAKEDARERLRRGRESIESGDWRQALDALTRAIALDPKLAIAYNARGYVYLRMRQPRQALADFTEAIRLNTAYLNAYHNRAVARRLLGDSAGAAEDDRSFDRITQTLGHRVEAATPSTAGHP